MSNAENLEPLEESAQAASAAPTVTPVVQTSGMSAPAFNPRAHKQYYRFMFAAVIMLLGCLMPFGPEAGSAGYKSLGGGFFTLISLGIVWASWVAISHNKFGGFTLRWIALGFFPFAIILFRLITWKDLPAFATAPETVSLPADWSEWGRSLNIKNAENAEKMRNWVKFFGSGQLMLLLGSALAEWGMLAAIFGGVKAGKQQKAAAQASRAGRRR